MRVPDEGYAPRHRHSRVSGDLPGSCTTRDRRHASTPRLMPKKRRKRRAKPLKLETKYPRETIGVSTPRAPLGVPPKEVIASYLRDLATRGKGCTSNTRSMAMALGLSLEIVKTAKEELVAERRLIAQWQQWISIDGILFGKPVTSDLERLKDFLRRHFRLVCDVRTVDDPGHAHDDPPRLLVVGDRRISLTEAFALAARIAAGEGIA